MKFKHTLILLTALLGFSSITAQADLASIFTNTAPAPRALPRRTSIILIVADGLGYGDLSCYGQTKFQTPNLDQLAAEGMRFTNYYAADSSASPGWAALMLGRDAEHLQQRAGAEIPLAPGETTVAQTLKRSGYSTGFIGKWVLGDENSSGAPWKEGFSEFAGYFSDADANNFYANYVWRYEPGNPAAQRPGFTGKEMVYPNTGDHPSEYIPDLLGQASLNFINNNVPDRYNHYRPFFLVLNYPLPGLGNGAVPTDAPYSEEAWPQPQKNKAAMISRLDEYVGQLRERLQKLQLTNNVAIFFTSAAGSQISGGVDPNFFHSMESSNSLRVPMIVRWSTRIPAGQVSAVAWTAADFLPTAADIAFVPPPQGIDGVSILPSLLNKKSGATPARP